MYTFPTAYNRAPTGKRGISEKKEGALASLPIDDTTTHPPPIASSIILPDCQRTFFRIKRDRSILKRQSRQHRTRALPRCTPTFRFDATKLDRHCEN